MSNTTTRICPSPSPPRTHNCHACPLLPLPCHRRCPAMCCCPTNIVCPHTLSCHPCPHKSHASCCPTAPCPCRCPVTRSCQTNNIRPHALNRLAYPHTTGMPAALLPPVPAGAPLRAAARTTVPAHNADALPALGLSELRGGGLLGRQGGRSGPEAADGQPSLKVKGKGGREGKTGYWRRGPVGQERRQIRP